MNKNIWYGALVLIILGGVSWFVWPGFGSNNSKIADNSSVNLKEQSKDPTATQEASLEQAESLKCVNSFNNSKLSNMTIEATDKFVTLSVNGFGDIKVELDRKAAPKTSENFIKLAKAGFYDCLTFHRVAKDFVIQGGDPEGTGQGGPGYTIPAEIGLLHKKGSIAMARLGDQVNPSKASSGSQFYFALNDLPMLDGQYTVFGQVVSGMDVVQKIGAVAITPGPFGGGDGSPVEKVEITKATVSAE